MITVRAHTLKTPIAADSVKVATAFIENDLTPRCAQYPDYAGKCADHQMIDVTTAYGLGDLTAMHRFSNVVADLAAGAFKIWRQEGPVDFTIEGKAVHSEDCAPSYGSTPSDWLQHFCLAVALRREDAVQVLVDYPEAQLKKAPAGFDGAWFPLINALKSFWLRSKAYATFLAEFMQKSEVQSLSVMSPKHAEPYRALMPALDAIDLLDQQAFTNCLVAGLKAHKDVMGRGSNANRVTGLLSPLVLGFAALGVRRGLKFEVDSGYCPAWLVNQGSPP